MDSKGKKEHSKGHSAGLEDIHRVFKECQMKDQMKELTSIKDTNNQAV